MTNQIGTKIKFLRNKNDITQEKMADYLGITPQAISRWESGNGYPDIEMLPIIANFFNVTTDELLGVNLARNEQQIESYLSMYKEYNVNGKRKEKRALMKEAVSLFPTDHRILNKYAWTLFDNMYDNFIGDSVLTQEEMAKTKNEVVSVCNRILNDCIIEEIRYDTLEILCMVYAEMGDGEKAIQIANRFSGYFQSKSDKLEHILSGNEYEKQLQENTEELCFMLRLKICANASNVQHDEEIKIKLYKKALLLLNLVYEDNDYNFYSCDVAGIYFKIAMCNKRLGNIDEVLYNLKQAAKFAKEHDNATNNKFYTSILVNKLKTDVNKRSKGYTGSFSNVILLRLNEAEFDDLKNNNEFINIVKFLNE